MKPPLPETLSRAGDILVLVLFGGVTTSAKILNELNIDQKRKAAFSRHREFSFLMDEQRSNSTV